MSKVFIVDVAKCSGCLSCLVACKDEYVDNDWTPYSKPQPDIGQHWLDVKQFVNGTIPKVKVHYLPTLCNHCENPACEKACAAEAITRHPDGFMIIEPEKCVGCGSCVDACPYGAIFFNKDLNIAQKCTGCAHLLDNGYTTPRCVENCPNGALTFGEEADLQKELAGTTTLKPELGMGGKVHYRNIPGQWIAGTVFDEEADEVVIGARVFAMYGGKRYETYTDEFGDFWLKDLPIGSYTVTIVKSGLERKKFEDIYTDKCVNLGDIPLKKA